MDKKSNFTHLMRIFAVVAIAIVVITVISRIVNNVNDKVDSIGGGTKATSTTETEATTIAPSDCTNHEYKNGACIKCGTVCAHEESAAGDTGNSYCTVCGTLTALKAPLITASDNNTVSWEAVPEASGYIIYVDDKTYVTTDTFYDHSSDVAGDFTVCVAAAKNTIISEKSNSYTFTYYAVTADTVEHSTFVALDSSVVVRGGTFGGRIKVDEGYDFPAAISVTMGGNTTTTNVIYDVETGYFTVSNVTGALHISYDIAEIYSVSENENDHGYIWGVGSAEPSYTVKEGSDYTGRVIVYDGYALPSTITVTMGGVTLTSGVTYDSETGIFTIVNVTGDLYITYDAPSSTLAAPTQLSIDDTNLYWYTVPGATAYKIRVLSTDLETVVDKYYTVTDPEGETSVYRKSISLDTFELTESGTYHIAIWGYNDTDEGEAASIQYVYNAGYTVTFNISEDANGLYDEMRQYSLDGSTWHNITVAETLTLEKVKYIWFRVVGDGTNTAYIEWTNPVGSLTNGSYSVDWVESGKITLEGDMSVTYGNTENPPQLAAPAASIEGDILTIEDDGTATEYEIYVDGVLVATVAAGNSAASTAALSYYYSGDKPNHGVYYSADGGDWTLLNNADGVTNVQCSTIKFKIEDIASSGEVCWSTDVNDYTGYESFCCVDDTCIDYVSYADGWFYTDEIPISGTVVIELCSGSGNVPI